MYSIYIQSFTMFSLFALMIIDSLSYSKSRDAVASKKKQLKLSKWIVEYKLSIWASNDNLWENSVILHHSSHLALPCTLLQLLSLQSSHSLPTTIFGSRTSVATNTKLYQKREFRRATVKIYLIYTCAWGMQCFFKVCLLKLVCMLKKKLCKSLHGRKTAFPQS